MTVHVRARRHANLTSIYPISPKLFGVFLKRAAQHYKSFQSSCLRGIIGSDCFKTMKIKLKLTTATVIILVLSVREEEITGTPVRRQLHRRAAARRTLHHALRPYLPLPFVCDDALPASRSPLSTYASSRITALLISRGHTVSIDSSYGLSSPMLVLPPRPPSPSSSLAFISRPTSGFPATSFLWKSNSGGALVGSS